MARGSYRHDISQKFYVTDIFRSKNLRRKRVNHENSDFATKQRKCLDLTTNYILRVKVAQQFVQYL